MTTTARELDLTKISLKKGGHKSIEDGACVMEMVSYMANEPWSDQPQCACPVLTEYAIRMNDRFNDEDRQKMVPLIPLLIGTRKNAATKITRRRLIRWRNVTATFPLILDCIGAGEYAQKLRTFENNLESMALASAYLKEHGEAMRKIAYANAYAYAYAIKKFKELRSQIADIAIQTLRLAIDVNVE